MALTTQEENALRQILERERLLNRIGEALPAMMQERADLQAQRTAWVARRDALVVSLTSIRDEAASLQDEHPHFQTLATQLSAAIFSIGG